ncbi:hypothetical protein MRX96_039448 [Rhipicephalus microplus]
MSRFEPLTSLHLHLLAAGGAAKGASPQCEYAARRSTLMKPEAARYVEEDGRKAAGGSVCVCPFSHLLRPLFSIAETWELRDIRRSLSSEVEGRGSLPSQEAFGQKLSRRLPRIYLILCAFLTRAQELV